MDGSNSVDLLFFTDRQRSIRPRPRNLPTQRRAYWANISLPAWEWKRGETVLYMAAVQKYAGYMLFL